MWVSGQASYGNEIDSINELFDAEDAYGNSAATWDRLLRACREMQATAPRDKIFGMLGLITEISKEHGRELLAMVVDYRMQVEEGFKAATTFSMQWSRPSA